MSMLGLLFFVRLRFAAQSKTLLLCLLGMLWAGQVLGQLDITISPATPTASTPAGNKVFNVKWCDVTGAGGTVITISSSNPAAFFRVANVGPAQPTDLSGGKFRINGTGRHAVHGTLVLSAGNVVEETVYFDVQTQTASTRVRPNIQNRGTDYMCQGETRRLVKILPHGTDEVQWYRNGIHIATTTGLLEVSDFGTYTARLGPNDGSCLSDVSNPMDILELKLDAPTLTRTDGEPLNLNQVCTNTELKAESATAPGTTTYEWWHNVPNATAFVGQTFKPTAAGLASYSVRAKHGNCESALVTMTVIDAPDAPIIKSSKSEYCEGDKAELEATFSAGSTAPAGAIYQWERKSLASASTGLWETFTTETTSKLPISGLGKYNYQVKVKNNITGCWSAWSDPKTVAVLEKITGVKILNAAGDEVTAICLSDPKIALTASWNILAGGLMPSGFDWNLAYASAAGQSQRETYPTNQSFIPKVAGEYRLIVDNGNQSCSGVATIKVLEALPTPSISSKSAYCAPEKAELEAIFSAGATAPAGALYTWARKPLASASGWASFGASSASNQTTITDLGEYEYRVQVAVGICLATSTPVTVSTIATPRVSITSSHPSKKVCLGQTVRLSSTDLAGGVAATGWSWESKPPSGGVTVVGTGGPQTWEVIAEEVGMYIITHKAYSNKDCYTTIIDSFEVFEPAKAKIAHQAATGAYCLNEELVFASISTGLIQSYTWSITEKSTNAIIPLINADKDIFRHFFTKAGTYIIRLAITGECVANPADLFTETEVTIHPRPFLTWDPTLGDRNLYVCENTPLVVLQSFKQTTPGVVAKTTQYMGAGIVLKELFDPSLAGVGRHVVQYQFLTDQGCESNQIAERIIEVYPIPRIELPKTIEVMAESSHQMPAKVNNQMLSNYYPNANNTYSWTPSTGLSDPAILNPRLNLSASQKYTLTTSNQKGCVSQQIINVLVLHPLIAASVITPNNDGYNDSWVIKNAELFPQMQIMVYNRLGALVWQSVGYQTPWNGKSSAGSALAAGTYFYTINPRKGPKFPVLTGSIEIIY